ncbi:hypothetical protein QC760_010469 [Botrytis cinerea]
MSSFLNKYHKNHPKKPDTPSTNSSVNSSTHNVTSTNVSSSTQVASTASLKSGTGEGSKHRNHKSHRSHDVSTSSLSTMVNSSSSSAKGAKNTDSGNGGHQEKKSSHEPGTTPSQAPVSKPRPELKQASKSFLLRKDIDPEEKKKEEILEQEHRDLQAQKHSDFTYVKAHDEVKLEQLRYQLAKEHLEFLKKKDPSAAGKEIEEQEREVESTRKTRNEADAKFKKIHEIDEGLAEAQRVLLSKMREEWEIEQAEEKERVKQAAKKADEAEQKKIANEMKTKEKTRMKETEVKMYNRDEFEKSRAGQEKSSLGNPKYGY